MNFFVTGANGFIGFELTKKLIEHNHKVNVLVRNRFPEINATNLTVFKGSLSDVEIIDKGIKGCEYVFHLAGFADIWSKDKMIPFKTNVTGTRNILDCALKNTIKRVVFTSTAGVLSPSEKNQVVNESTPLPNYYLTDYELTKYEAEKLCLEYYKKGLDVVIVNPTRVYGPGKLNKSNSVTILIQKFLQKKWRIIPGDGKQIANYAFIEDVVLGHLSAIEKGKAGENYILGGTNLSYNEFFRLLSNTSGIKIKLINVNLQVLYAIAQFSVLCSKMLNKKPFITPAWVKKLMQNRIVSSKKAEIELDYNITSIDKGIFLTITWLKTNK